MDWKALWVCGVAGVSGCSEQAAPASAPQAPLQAASPVVPMRSDASAGTPSASAGAAPLRPAAGAGTPAVPSQPAPQLDAAVVDVDAGPVPKAGAAAPAVHVASFFIGADITWVQADEAHGATYSDGSAGDILALLKRHGFNAIRMRTFVDPRAADGYDQKEGYGDLAHTIALAKRVKAAGMAVLLDFHYSDNWADPEKQCVPIAWQGLRSIDELAHALHDYTHTALMQLKAAGASPELVQIGNEITPGMLLHRCDASGKPTGGNPVTGSSSDWANLGKLLSAGADAVREVDPAIRVMLHIERCHDLQASRNFIQRAQEQGVRFDVFAESCYTAYQGTPDKWRATFMQLAQQFPALQFVIAEYGPEQRAANDLMFGLSGQHGLGTFNWEPTHTGDWNRGHALFDVAGKAYTATPDLELYDAMKQAYADRL